MKATTLLHADHEKVSGLLASVESAADFAEKRKLVEKIKVELTTHARLEEQFFYPALQGDSQAAPLVQHAQEEHNTLKSLLSSLTTPNVSEEQFNTQFQELKKAVEDHVREEEGAVFDAARRIMNMKQNLALGEQMKASQKDEKRTVRAEHKKEQKDLRKEQRKQERAEKKANQGTETSEETTSEEPTPDPVTDPEPQPVPEPEVEESTPELVVEEDEEASSPPE